MTENFLQILLYLFQHHVSEGVLRQDDHESLVEELGSVGFNSLEARYAIEWLGGFTQSESAAKVVAKPSSMAMRAFTQNEILKLNTRVRGFLFFLQQNKLLSDIKRELIIERAMALKTHRVDLHDLYYIVNMVLMNGDAKDEASQQMHRLLLVNTGTKH